MISFMVLISRRGHQLPSQVLDAGYGSPTPARNYATPLRADDLSIHEGGSHDSRTDIKYSCVVEPAANSRVSRHIWADGGTKK